MTKPISKRILVTAFEPFGSQTVNASQEVLKLLPGVISEYEVQTAVLPVEFGEAGRRVLELAGVRRPEFIFMLGEAGGRAFVTPETTARNVRVSGHEKCAVIPQGADELRTVVPVREIISQMQGSLVQTSDDISQMHGYPIQASDDAGTYVCNDTFYTVLNGTAGTGTVVDFIHVPYCKLQERSVALDESGREITRVYPAMETELAAKTVVKFIELTMSQWGRFFLTH